MVKKKTKKKTEKKKTKKKAKKKETKKKTKKKVEKKPKVSKVKEKVKKKAEKEAIKKKKVVLKPERYYQTQGRRKTSVARIRVWTKGSKEFLINGKPLKEYFPTLELQKTASASLEKMKCQDKFKISVIVRGGGISGQAEAIRHGIARALVLFNPDFRKRLKKAGFLRRDSRMRERKKFGLRRARRAKQWSKR